MEMSGERIGMVLVRASELHSKIATCIQNSSLPPLYSTPSNHINGDDIDNDIVDVDDSSSQQADHDADALFGICDAFHSLEAHLSSFQALQQQQQYEREAVIRDIEYNRKMLLKKLNDYKGEHLDVIREAEAFASMKVEDDDDFFPPYPAHSPNSLGLDNSLPSGFSNSRKLVQNGHDSRDEYNKSEPQNNSNKVWGGLRFLVSTTAKTVLTIVGVVSLLSLAGFEPKLKTKGKVDLSVLTLFESIEKRLGPRCPPGKVAVMENGETHCIVKERVEIPFDSVAVDPDVNYGCG